MPGRGGVPAATRESIGIILPGMCVADAASLREGGETPPHPMAPHSSPSRVHSYPLHGAEQAVDSVLWREGVFARVLVAQQAFTLFHRGAKRLKTVFPNFALIKKTLNFAATEKNQLYQRAMEPDIINKIVKYLKGQPVLRAWIFGSYSRGEQRPDSDIDIMVKFMPSSKVSLMRHASMMVDLEDLLQRRVDLVTENGLAEFARPSVNHDRILIYERAD